MISFCLFLGAQYVKCRAQRCTEGNRQYLFPGHVDTNSLVVQDEYVFTQVCVMIHYLIKLNQLSSSFHAKAALWFSFVFIFGLLCIQFMLFHQNPRNGFPQHTCSPLAQCVFWLCFVSFMSRHAQCLSFRTDIHHAWKMCFLAHGTRQRNCE